MILLRPLDDLLVEGSKTIEIPLLPGDGYSLPVVDKASIELVDDDGEAIAPFWNTSATFSLLFELLSML